MKTLSLNPLYIQGSLGGFDIEKATVSPTRVLTIHNGMASSATSAATPLQSTAHRGSSLEVGTWKGKGLVNGITIKHSLQLDSIEEVAFFNTALRLCI
ncbi:hypothetical protein D5086_013076 [Populus alba]|uniref:Uncharacterized protein n=1 Tax=Populus alba TaxID=43335 RepID=A0ACC4C3X9_POPAL